MLANFYLQSYTNLYIMISYNLGTMQDLTPLEAKDYKALEQIYDSF
jgi:hypothetical protein